MARTFDSRASGVSQRHIDLAGMALLLWGAATAQACASTLCHADEAVWFSCRVGPAKMVSLCGTRETLQYRFGTPRQLEMSYPAAPTSGYAAFQWAHHDRYQASRTEVRFNHAGIDYILFDHIEHVRRETGLDIASTRRMPCLGALQSRLGQLRDKLPCDEESALNLGACPGHSD